MVRQFRWLAVPATVGILALTGVLVFAPVLCLAGEAVGGGSALAAQVAKAQASADEAALAGHNAWMLTSTALVLFMTAPGLAMFYSGLVRKKNVVGVMMQCLFLMALMSVVWALWGYSLAFGGNGAWIGNGQYLGLRGVARFWDAATGQPVTPMVGKIPRQIGRAHV